jgi:hypothetical protein
LEDGFADCPLQVVIDKRTALTQALIDCLPALTEKVISSVADDARNHVAQNKSRNSKQIHHRPIPPQREMAFKSFAQLCHSRKSRK